MRGLRAKFEARGQFCRLRREEAHRTATIRSSHCVGQPVSMGPGRFAGPTQGGVELLAIVATWKGNFGTESRADL